MAAQPQPQPPEADIENALSNLQRLSDEELQRCIDDEDYFESFVTNLNQIERWENDKEILIASNKSLAEYNLSFEPKLQEGKQNLMKLYEKARSLTDELETKRAQLESLGSRTSLDTTHALLQAAAAESEEQSDSLTDKFLAGSTNLESFLSEFVPLRITSHLRKLKADKMAEIINSQRTRSGYSSGAPYPNQPMMPQPVMPM